MEKICKYCKEKIEYINKNQLASHYGNCKYHPSYKIKIEKLKKVWDERKRKIYSLKKISCLKCKKEILINVTDNNFKNGTYKKYCSNKCAKSRIHTHASNKKRSETLIGRKHTNETKQKIKKRLKEIGLTKINGSERHNRINALKTFELYKGICQGCFKKLEKENYNMWIAHHKIIGLKGEDYNNSKDRELYCSSCHTSLHRKIQRRSLIR